MAPEKKPEEKKEDKKQLEEKRAREKATQEWLDRLEVKEISIWLDNYDDIFSDFDPRPYTTRELSADFLKEVNRRYMETRTGVLEVRFLIPQNERDEDTEEIIKKHLRAHFHSAYREVLRRLDEEKRNGLAFILAGAGVIILQQVIHMYVGNDIPSSFFEILMVGGWFATWTGMDKYFFSSQKDRQELEMSERLCKAEFIFISEEEPKSTSK